MDRITKKHFDSESLKKDGSNWGFWKYRMELILKKRKLFTLVEGNKPRPDPNDVAKYNGPIKNPTISARSMGRGQ